MDSFMSINLKRKIYILPHVICNYGVGLKTSISLIRVLGFNSRLCFKLVTCIQKKKIIKSLKKLRINQFLQRYLWQLKNFSSRIRTYKFVRNNLGLPARGQRTRTNSKTKKKWRKLKN